MAASNHFFQLFRIHVNVSKKLIMADDVHCVKYVLILNFTKNIVRRQQRAMHLQLFLQVSITIIPRHIEYGNAFRNGEHRLFTLQKTVLHHCLFRKGQTKKPLYITFCD